MFNLTSHLRNRNQNIIEAEQVEFIYITTIIEKEAINLSKNTVEGVHVEVMERENSRKW